MKEKLKRLFGLFGAFAVVGVTTFGGGYAMRPALQREVVEKRRWATEEEVMDWYAIGQCTPGVIAVNTATFVGQKQAGVWGGIFATLGVVFPSLVIIMIIAAFIQNFAHLPAVQNAFAGIRVCVCVLILNAVVKLWKKSVVDWKTFLIFLLVFAGSVFLSISPVLYVLAAALAGIVIKEPWLVCMPLVGFVAAVGMLVSYALPVDDCRLYWGLWFGLSFLVMMVVPGHIINRKAKRACSGN